MATIRTLFGRPVAMGIRIAAMVAALLTIAPLHADFQVPETTPVCIPAANKPPVAVADSATTYSTVKVTIRVLDNDSDPEGKVLTIASITQPNRGSVVVNADKTLTYNPGTGGDSVEQFSYVVKDPDGGMASGLVSVTVKAIRLVLALGFNEAAGLVAEDSGPFNYDGAIKEAMRVAGQTGYGSALSFDGINDLVTVPDKTHLRLTTGMTVEAWVFPTGNSGWTPVLFKERGRPGLSYALQARDGAPLAGGTDKPAGYARIALIDRAVRGTSALPLSTWSHIAMTYDGAYQRFYVNGVLAQERAQTGKIEGWSDPALAGIYIGGYAPWNEYFKGRIDDLRVYAVALGADQIQADMATPLP